MEWFRLYHEFSSDPKVQTMSEAMQRRLVMLMCLRCCNTLETLQEQELCFSLQIDESELAETKMLFIRKKFIDDDWNLLHWDQRQAASDSSTARVRRHRAKKETLPKRPLKQEGNVSVTDRKKERKKEREIDTARDARARTKKTALPDDLRSVSVSHSGRSKTATRTWTSIWTHSSIRSGRMTTAMPTGTGPS